MTLRSNSLLRRSSLSHLNGPTNQSLPGLSGTTTLSLSTNSRQYFSIIISPNFDNQTLPHITTPSLTERWTEKPGHHTESGSSPYPSLPAIIKSNTTCTPSLRLFESNEGKLNNNNTTTENYSLNNCNELKQSRSNNIITRPWNNLTPKGYSPTT